MNIQQWEEVILIAQWKVYLYLVKTHTQRTWDPDWIVMWWRKGAYFLKKSNEIDDATTVNNFGFKSVLTPLKVFITMHLMSTHTTWCVILGIKELIQYSKVNLIKVLIWLIKTNSYLLQQINLTTLVKLVKTPKANYCKTTSQNPMSFQLTTSPKEQEPLQLRLNSTKE